MKKIFSVMLAGMLAISFSAFHPVKKMVDTLYYESSIGHFDPVPSGVDVCPEGESTQCIARINGVDYPLWKNLAGTNPYKKQ